MTGKIGKIVLSIVLSFVFFIAAAILINWIAGMIFGTKSNGDADFNGGILLAVTSALTVSFAIWFYTYVHLYKKDKPQE